MLMQGLPVKSAMDGKCRLCVSNLWADVGGETAAAGGANLHHQSSVVVDIRGCRNMFCAEGMLGLLVEMLPLEKQVNLAFVGVLCAREDDAQMLRICYMDPAALNEKNESLKVSP